MFRPFVPEDREAYIALSREFYSSSAVMQPVPDDHFWNAFYVMMEDHSRIRGFMIEAEDKKPVGYAIVAFAYSVEAGGEVVWLEELYLLPEARNAGLGTKVFAFMEEQFPNAMRFRLEVAPDNTRAIELYEHLGYSRVPYIPMIKERKNPAAGA